MSEEQLIKITPHPTDKVIRKSEDYVVDGMGKVTVMTAVDPAKAAAAGEPTALHQGFAILGANVGGQIRQFPVEFLIEGVSTVEEAFGKFQELAVATLRHNMEEARKHVEAEHRKIQIAGSVPNMKITR